MRITFKHQRDLGTVLARALRDAGHELVDGGGDVLLIDHDLPVGHYQALCDAHARVILYPHGAGLVASGDGQWPVHPHTVARLEHGPGQVEVLRRAGYPRRAEVIGWPLCLRRPFAPRPLRRVLLAPSHAIAGGWYPPELAAQNRRLYEQLVGLAARRVIELTVRMVFGLPPGIEPGFPSGRVVYELGDGTISGALECIGRHDCVVGSAWTFPTLAVARGVPTVMYGQLPLDDNQGLGDTHLARHWATYRDYVRFPLDAAATDDLSALLARACTTDADIAEWRERFIGPAFDPARFVGLVEELAAS